MDAMKLLFAMFIVVHDNWTIMKNWIEVWQILPVGTLFLSPEIWTHKIGGWFPSGLRCVQNVEYYGAVTHRKTNIEVPLPFQMTIPTEKFYGQKPD